MEDGTRKGDADHLHRHDVIFDVLILVQFGDNFATEFEYLGRILIDWLLLAGPCCGQWWIMSTIALVSRRWNALGTYIDLATTDAEQLDAMCEVVNIELDLLDRTVSCYREDSEVRRLYQASCAQRGARAPYEVSPELFSILSFALWGAELTNGLVDPTIGGALARFDLYPGVSLDDHGVSRIDLVPGFRSISLDAQRHVAVLPRRVLLDLHSVSKGLWADRVAKLLADRFQRDVLVGLGGDIAVVSPAETTFPIAVPYSGASQYCDGDPVIGLGGGGLATSSVRWRTFDVTSLGDRGVGLSHIVDPKTTLPVDSPFATVSVAGPSAAVANVFSLATIVGGVRGFAILKDSGYAARITTSHDEVYFLGGWENDLQREESSC